MMRILTREAVDGDHDYIEAAGTSNDNLPEGNFTNGSWVLLVDTKQVVFYNEDIPGWDTGE